MLRLRLAHLALASGLLVCLSGCMTGNPFSESRLCSRSHSGNLMSRPAPIMSAAPAFSPECDCHQSYLPPAMDFEAYPGIQYPATQFPGTQYPGTQFPGTQFPGMQPPITMPPPTPIPITNMPVGQPPLFRTSPQAVPSPYTP